MPTLNYPPTGDVDLKLSPADAVENIGTIDIELYPPASAYHKLYPDGIVNYKLSPMDIKLFSFAKFFENFYSPSDTNYDTVSFYLNDLSYKNGRWTSEGEDYSITFDPNTKYLSWGMLNGMFLYYTSTIELSSNNKTILIKNDSIQDYNTHFNGVSANVPMQDILPENFSIYTFLSKNFEIPRIENNKSTLLSKISELRKRYIEFANVQFDLLGFEQSQTLAQIFDSIAYYHVKMEIPMNSKEYFIASIEPISFGILLQANDPLFINNNDNYITGNLIFDNFSNRLNKHKLNSYDMGSESKEYYESMDLESESGINLICKEGIVDIDEFDVSLGGDTDSCKDIMKTLHKIYQIEKNLVYDYATLQWDEQAERFIIIKLTKERERPKDFADFIANVPLNVMKY